MTSDAAVLTIVQKTRGILRTFSVCGVSTTTQFGTSISSAGNTTEFGTSTIYTLLISNIFFFFHILQLLIFLCYSMSFIALLPKKDPEHFVYIVQNLILTRCETDIGIDGHTQYGRTYVGTLFSRLQCWQTSNEHWLLL